MCNRGAWELQAIRIEWLRGTVSTLAVMTIGALQMAQGHAETVRMNFSNDGAQALRAVEVRPVHPTARASTSGNRPDQRRNFIEPSSPLSSAPDHPANEAEMSVGNGGGEGNRNAGANASGNGNNGGTADSNGGGAGTGNAGANGPGNGNNDGGPANGNGGGAGNGNAGANASGNGNNGGPANGNGNGAGNGNAGANAPGNGNNGGPTNGNGGGAGNGNAGANAPGNGNNGDPANGNGGGAGNGNAGANGPGNGNNGNPANGNGGGAGNGNAGANGPGNGNNGGPANGNGSSNSGGNGLANRQGALTAQTAALAPAENAVSQVQQFLEKDLESKAGAKLNGALASIHQYSTQNDLSVFAVSGVSRLRHDGMSVSTPQETFRGPAFTAWTYGLTAGLRWDGSSTFGLAPSTLLFGGFGHYASTDFDIGERDGPIHGSGNVRGYSVGGYSLLNIQPFYVLGIFNHGWSYAEMSGPGGVEFAPEGVGYLLSANAGALMTVAPNLKLDLRVGVDVSRATVDDYRDSAGHAYTGAFASESSGSASAKLFSHHQFGGATIRPFAQAGISQRFDQTNRVTIDGTAYSFTEADFSAFGRVGIDIDCDGFQSYLAFKAESSADRHVISGQIGITVKLD
jgi:hypothetical protein